MKLAHVPLRPPALLALLATLSACAGSAPPDARPIAECPVCRCNADLGCLTVHIDSSTPRATYRGVTYFFCSPDCRCAFEKTPDKFAAK